MRTMKAVLYLTAAVALIGCAESQQPNMATLLSAIMQLERSSMQEPCDDSSDQKIYDFIVVGAGAAGSVLANRLTEVKEWEVLVLEAGGEETAIMDVPYFASVFQQSDANWQYRTVRSETRFKAMIDQRLNYPSGRVVGGSTDINYMFSIRGNKRDYDNWENMGNPGWDFDSVLPYFLKSEDVQIPELKTSDYHSTGGHIKVSYPPYRSPISSIFIAAGKEMGEQEVDYNGEKQTGFSRIQTTTANGSRWSASKGYLHPIHDRRNLHLKKRSLVYNILLHKLTKTAYGVQFTKDGKNYTVYAKKEVILSAGAINSPQLLMLSGIGPKEHLKNLSISVVQDLMVGHNLMDHVGFGGLIFTVNDTKAFTTSQILGNPQNYINYSVSSNGPLTSTGPFETVSFLELKNTSDYSPGWPNVETLYFSTLPPRGNGVSDEVYNAYVGPIQNESSYQCYVFQLRPKSRGTVTLKDKNIHSSPNIDPKFLTEEEDIQTSVAGIKKMIELSKTDALQKIGAKLHDVPVPQCKELLFGSDEYWRCALNQMPISIYHQCGTCKMGPVTEKSSVVDSKMNVHGIRKLRVVDASVFPQIVSGHLQMTVYMLAEKAADIIKKDHYIH